VRFGFGAGGRFFGFNLGLRFLTALRFEDAMMLPWKDAKAVKAPQLRPWRDPSISPQPGMKPRRLCREW
jgi:hypothetical protein